MKRTHIRWIAPAVASLAVAWAYAGPARGQGQAQKTGEKVGQKLDDVGREIKGGLNRAGTATREQFARARTSVHNMGVESRVYGRLHWDKALNDATIELMAGSDGVVTLNGTVADARAKRRAVELTQETVGVTRVDDQLAIRPALAPTTP